jgi:hypothetical protein
VSTRVQYYNYSTLYSSFIHGTVLLDEGPDACRTSTGADRAAITCTYIIIYCTCSYQQKNIFPLYMYVCTTLLPKEGRCLDLHANIPNLHCIQVGFPSAPVTFKKNDTTSKRVSESKLIPKMICSMSRSYGCAHCHGWLGQDKMTCNITRWSSLRMKTLP